ncbi:hypothetical protein CsatA_028720 [Cannabis sativa]
MHVVLREAPENFVQNSVDAKSFLGIHVPTVISMTFSKIMVVILSMNTVSWGVHPLCVRSLNHSPRL